MTEDDGDFVTWMDGTIDMDQKESRVHADSFRFREGKLVWKRKL